MSTIRRIALTLLCFTTVAMSTVVAPKPVQAQGIPVIDVTQVTQQTSKQVLDKIGEVITNAALVGVKNLLSAFLGKLAYDAAVYIASGGTGQDSLVYDQSFGDYMLEAGDAAVGGLIEGFATEAGLDAAGLCNPGDSFLINLTIGLEVTPVAPYQPACTLTELGENWQEAYSDPEFGDFVALQFDSTANPLGISLEAQNLTLVAREQAEEDAEKQREEDGGFKSKTESVSKTIVTPASVIQEDLAQSKENVAWYSLQSTDNPVVEALNIFTSTLISKLLERAQQGLANLRSGSELSGLLGGEFSGSVTGRAAAEAVYAELKQPIFGSSGTFDLLADLVACPDEEDIRSVENCTIGSTLQTAIQEGWTIQEFIDYQTEIGQTFSFASTDSPVSTTQIQNSEGVTQTGVTVLKKYRVVPVGWQVAADYVANSSDNPTLEQLVNCYNYCGTADEERSCDFVLTDSTGASTDYSPYCKLIDPYWVFKAPQNFCEREAPGYVIAEQDNYDTDGNSYTQEEITLERINYCADSRACIQEEQEDVCTAYGYCTEEERIYRFDGDICEEEYSSCETFTDDNGDPVSLVKTSLNYNDCATDPGCQWYCKSQNDAGEFDCASPTETYVSCSEDVTTNESDYGLTYDISYDENEACGCEETPTCQVPAGSTSGDGDGDGLVDFRECEIANTDGTVSVCTLDDNCGSSNSAYNSATSTCTCSVTISGDVELGDSTVDVTVEDSTGADATYTCSLDDEDGDSAADTCSEDYSTYSNAPVCSSAGGTYCYTRYGVETCVTLAADEMFCGDICYTDTGGTCTNNLGNTCTDGSSSDSDSTDGECVLSDSCDISTGLYSCTSEDGNVCILGTIAEEPATVSDTIYFDNNVEECDASDAGCTEYIRIKADTNLLPNAFFDYYDDNQDVLNDENVDDLAFCTHDGGGCASDSYCDEDSDGTPEGQCIGWVQNGASAYLLDTDYDSLLAPDVGTNAVQLGLVTTSGTLDMTVDTGHSLANRTFTFAYRGKAFSDCEDVSFTIGSADGVDVSSAVTADSDATDYDYSTDWQDYTTTYTFADTTTDTDITVAIAASTTCEIYLGAASLVEDDEFSNDYANYAANNVTYLNSDTVSCEPEDVGCELYVEDGASDEDGIPGLITNPDSDDCVDASGNYNYDSPSCNQCNGDPDQDQDDDYYAGCDFYQEVALDNTTPITTDETWLSTEQREGVMTRSGKYCEGDSTQHCFVDSDCDTGSCLEQLSIVPSSGESCSVNAVGCEEYTNLAAVEEGGEGLEYYTDLKQCVRRDDQETAVFYTFEGSDVSGVQVQDHTLKVDTTTNAPCTHLDLQSEDFNADCTDSTDYTSAEQLEWDCGPDGDIDGDGILNNPASGTDDTTTDDEEYGTDADCRQYVTADGDIFYRYESQVIEASDDCTPLRNSTDTRVYFALPNESDDCSAEEVSCREYKGTDSGSEETIVDEDFSDNSTEEWSGATSTSNESVLQSGYSLQLHDSDTADTTNDEMSYELFTTEDTDDDGADDTTYGLLEDGKSYVLTFWAKADDGGSLAASIDYESTTGSNYYFTTAGSSTSSATITLDPNDEDGWQFYAVGPVILPEGTNLDDGDEYFKLQYTGTATTSEAYIDTIVLAESNSQYLIQDTARACNNFEGCRLYEDRDGSDHYLKSFKRLCDDTVVGCEAMIQTFNSTHPFTEAFNLDNEYDQDDVIVQYDQPTTLVYSEDNECSSTVKGCTEFGLADVDDRTGEILDYESTYFLDLPDSYDSTLCEQPQLSCREYTSEYDGTVYFKDPGEKLCELQEYTTESNTFNGWFKLDSEATSPDCPLQYDFSDYDETYASQPLGGVCNSNSAHHSYDSSGNIVVEDSKIGSLCSQDADCYPTDWDESVDAIPRCISSAEDDVDVFDGAAHQYVTYADDGVTLSDTVTDFGWAGTCPDDQSGCSEYIDPYSPNITEINRNWSFEDDVRNTSNTLYDDDDVADGFPDFWKVPYNMTLSNEDTNGDGSVDEGDTQSYTEVDIDGDGTADFTSSCDTTDAVITSVSGTTVNPADGVAAVGLTGPCVIQQYSSYSDLSPDKTYVIQAQVKMDPALMDSAEFSIGVHFYTSDYDDDGDIDLIEPDSDMVLYPVADHATIPAEDGGDEIDGLSYWYRFEGMIGLGSTVPIPTYSYCSLSTYGRPNLCTISGGTWITDTAASAAVFIVNHSTSTIYFDAASFKEADKYYYLDYTVDGTAEREQLDGTNTCINQDTEEGEITSDGGCVAFRDATSDTQNYSQDGLDCTTCLLTPNSDSCRYVIDACDTNTVLKVKKDRVCSEWLSCATAELVEDDNGNITSQCFDIQRCNGLDEDGNCSSSIDTTIGYDDLSATSDLHFNTAAGDTDELSAIRNLTGYTRVGLTWGDVLFCDGGPNDGLSCSTDDDCADTIDTSNSGTCSVPFSTEGYYPYGFMPEVGESGAASGEDLIELRDFEDLYCAGGFGDPSRTCVLNGTSDSDPGHCYTNEIKQKVESDIDSELVPSDFVYMDSSSDGSSFSTSTDADLAYCPNSPNFGTSWPFGSGGSYSYTEDGWQSTGGGDVFVTQYESYQDCPAPCTDIDLNNVLQIGSGGGDAFTGGVDYDLQDNINEDGTYTLTFNARYVDSSYTATDEGETPSTVQICLRHDNIGDEAGEELDRQDCFVEGFGQADIVFAIDTSGSMAGEIAAVQAAVPDLANQLSNAGIQAQFALVDLDDNDAVDDGGNTSDDNVGAQLGNYVDLDFTSDVDAFTSAVGAMSAESASVDPFNAIYEVANNSLFDDETLSFRADAQKFLVVVTDTGDEITSDDSPSNNIGATEAVNAAVAANLPVFVVTTGYTTCYTGETPTCQDYYDTYASETGGDAYDYTNPADGTTYSDWANNTTIVDDLFANIVANIDIFQFTTDMLTYTLGPITIEEKTLDLDPDIEEQTLGAGVTTALEFIGSDDSAFQIDNVSLLPVLEVNKDLNTIGRSCRAFPENVSKQCVYAEPSGTQFQGWKGYCLEAEFKETTEESATGFSEDDVLLDFPRAQTQQPARCITWFPLDVLEGETSIVQRDAAGYSGRSSVYHCLVSKGYEHAGFCDEDTYTSSSDNYDNDWGAGVICSADAACSTGSCFQGGTYTLTDDGACNDVISDQLYSSESDCTAAGLTWYDEHNDLGDSYSEDATDPYTDTSYVVRPLKWDMPDPVETTYMNELEEYLFGTINHTDEDCNDSQTEDEEDACITAADTAAAALQATFALSCGGSLASMLTNLSNPVTSAVCLTALGVILATANNYAENHALERGVIVRLPANEMLRNIHVSEMAGISFNPGSAGSGSATDDEYQVWGQLNGGDDSGISTYDHDGASTSETGNIWLTDLASGAIEFDEEGDDVVDKDNCFAYRSGDDKTGFGCRVWGLWDSNFLLDQYDDLPSMSSDDSDGTGGLDLVYTWVWGNYDWATTANDDDEGCNISSGDAEDDLYDTLEGGDINDWGDSRCVENALSEIAGDNGSADPTTNRNVWKDIEQNYSDLWDDFYESDTTGATVADIVTFTEDDIQGSSLWPDDDDSNDIDAANHGGGNLLSLFIDFNEEGYIQAVYVLEYVAAYGTMDQDFGNFIPVLVDTTSQYRMHLDIQLRESCAVVAESVAEDGSEVAWAERSAIDGYNISDGTSDEYSFSEPYEPFGSITPQETTPEEWDFSVLSEDDDPPIDWWSTFNAQPAWSMQTTDLSTAGHPLTCLGQCDDTACIGSPSVLGDDCTLGGDECGDTGVCMGIGDATISNEGQSSSYTNFTAQLEGTASDGADRLKHVFANINTFYNLTFYNNSTEATTYSDSPLTLYESTTAEASGYWDDSSGNMYDNMEPCNGDGTTRPSDYGDDEYCGVYPTVTSMTIDGELGTTSETYPINNGQTVELSFTSDVDPEQKALQFIYIDWGDESEVTKETWDADTTTHIYTHSYFCAPENIAYDDASDSCNFQPKITIVDNWDWCSGTQSGTCSSASYANEDACTGNEATWTSGGGDHRYSSDEGTDYQQSCQSYDEPNLIINVDATT